MEFYNIEEVIDENIKQLNVLYSMYLNQQRIEHLRLGLSEEDYGELDCNETLLKSYVEREDCRVSIATKSDNIFGFGIGRTVNKKPNLQAVIEDLMVVPEMRGLGIGKELFLDLKGWFESKECRNISLSTYWGSDAVEFYRSLGLVPVGINLNYKL